MMSGVIEYLDDFEGFAAEVLDADMRPIVRVQGRGQSVGTEMQAVIYLTHMDQKTAILRQAAILVGTEKTDNEEGINELQQKMRDQADEMRVTLSNRGFIVKKGRWAK